MFALKFRNLTANMKKYNVSQLNLIFHILRDLKALISNMWLMLVCCRDLQYITECQIQAFANLQLQIDIHPPYIPCKEWNIIIFYLSLHRNF